MHTKYQHNLVKSGVISKILYASKLLVLQYGGDRTRRDKLLKRQAEGKKRMKMFGKIEIPRETFIKVLER